VEEIQISGSRIDQSLQDTSRGNVRKRFIGVREIVAREICLQSRPRCGAVRVRDDLRAAVKVRKIGTPAAAYVQMLLVQIEMRIESCFSGKRTMIGVLAHNHYAASVAREAHRLNHRYRSAGGFQTNVRAASIGLL